MAKQKECRRKPWGTEKVGNVAVPIYRHTHAKRGISYESFEVKYYSPEHQLKRQAFADPERARKQANEVAEAFAKGDADAHQKNDQFVADACRAYGILTGAGFRDLVLPAQLLSDALKLVGKDQLLLAVRRGLTGIQAACSIRNRWPRPLTNSWPVKGCKSAFGVTGRIPRT
jgi:hypothetical protein